MKPSRFAQKLHKWLGLLVGLQLVLWSISGFYMVVIDLDIIHGNHLVTPSVNLSTEHLSVYSKNLQDTARRHSNATHITLSNDANRAIIRVGNAQSGSILNAATGEMHNALDQATIIQIAHKHYSGNSPILRTRLIKSDPPSEIGSRALPLWRVDFDDTSGTSLYLSPNTGALVTKRHTLWRIFDFFWMLHIMDYDERDDINNWLLRTVAIFALLLVLSGGWYLYFRLTLQSRRSKVIS